MKDWPWQKWIGKLLLLAVALGEAVLEGLEITDVSWWPAFTTFAVWLAQFIMGLIPAKE